MSAGVLQDNAQDSQEGERCLLHELSVINRLIVAEEGVQSKGVILFPVGIFTRR